MCYYLNLLCHQSSRAQCNNSPGDLNQHQLYIRYLWDVLLLLFHDLQLNYTRWRRLRQGQVLVNKICQQSPREVRWFLMVATTIIIFTLDNVPDRLTMRNSWLIGQDMILLMLHLPPIVAFWFCHQTYLSSSVILPPTGSCPLLESQEVELSCEYKDPQE